jgi:hypothetical protein
MNRAVLVGAALSALAGATGWLTAPRASFDTNPVSVAAPYSVDYIRGEYGRARDVLGRVGFVSVAEDIPEVAPPPPPDIAHLFRRDLTAIETRRDAPVVWVVDFSQPYGRRGLRVGDIYQDGWRVAAIEPQAIVLRRRRESRRVEAFAPAPEPLP